MKKPKCNCKRCKAMRVYRDKNHPWFDQAFWESINGGKTDRHPDSKYRLKNLKEFDDTGVYQY